MTKGVRNNYCVHKDDRVIEHTCECCKKCWLFVAGPRTGTCPYGGPFTGYKVVSK